MVFRHLRSMFIFLRSSLSSPCKLHVHILISHDIYMKFWVKRFKLRLQSHWPNAFWCSEHISCPAIALADVHQFSLCLDLSANRPAHYRSIRIGMISSFFFPLGAERQRHVSVLICGNLCFVIVVMYIQDDAGGWVCEKSAIRCFMLHSSQGWFLATWNPIGFFTRMGSTFEATQTN